MSMLKYRIGEFCDDPTEQTAEKNKLPFYRWISESIYRDTMGVWRNCWNEPMNADEVNAFFKRCSEQPTGYYYCKKKVPEFSNSDGTCKHFDKPIDSNEYVTVGFVTENGHIIMNPKQFLDPHYSEPSFLKPSCIDTK